MNRPLLGKTISATDRLVRKLRRRVPQGGLHATTYKVWEPYGASVVSPKPVKGIFVGYRFYANGWREWDDEQIYFIQDGERFEVWLVVETPMTNPVPVLPESTDEDIQND